MFYGYADKNGTADEQSVKGVILNSRILWFYSASYQLLQKKELLLMAEHAYRFLVEHCFDSRYGVMADRTMNTLLHVLECYTELYRADRFYQVGNSIREILEIFRTKIYNSDKKRCEVFFDMDYKSMINLESYGHDIETSWLINRACEVLGDRKSYDDMLPIIRGLAEGAYQNGIRHWSMPGNVHIIMAGCA